jgi:hypothetical protein
MTGSGIFIDYHGQIDCSVINSLLEHLKNNREFQELFTTIRKRTYSLIVESIENIYKHSALKSADDINRQPRIFVKNEKDQITIMTGNPVQDERKYKLIKMLEHVNSLDCDDLRKLHETRISNESVAGHNGAGLGLICMAFKSGHKLIYSFRPLMSGYSYFELKISLNK